MQLVRRRGRDADRDPQHGLAGRMDRRVSLVDGRSSSWITEDASNGFRAKLGIGFA